MRRMRFGNMTGPIWHAVGQWNERVENTTRERKQAAYRIAEAHKDGETTEEMLRRLTAKPDPVVIRAVRAFLAKNGKGK